MSHKRAKVLMVGPVHGQLRLLSDKLRSLQKSKAGPFDICLCAGPFFYHAGTSAKDANRANGAGESKHQTALNDGKALLEGELTFEIPVLFVDEGDGPPLGLVTASKVTNGEDSRKKDDDEIDLNDEDEDDDINVIKKEGNDEAEGRKNDDGAVPDGLFRVSSNLYQLVGDKSNRMNHALDSVADIISVPLPLIDQKSKVSRPKRDHPTSLTIGFCGPKIRLPCANFETKSQHTSFLGCDVFLSGEWGQGMFSKCGALTEEDRHIIHGADSNGTTSAIVSGEVMGSYDVAELVAMSRPRYHVAPGPLVPVPINSNDDGGDPSFQFRHRFIASLPYRYPSSTSHGSHGSHAGRFLAIGSVTPPSEQKALGKRFKFIHAVGIVPLALMDSNDREAAMELASVVDCPYTDASYDVDVGTSVRSGLSGIRNCIGMGTGGLSEARARRIVQEDAASTMASGGGEGGGGAYRWQHRPTRKRQRGDEDGGGSAGGSDEARQTEEANNPENRSLFLHGLHRDQGMTLTMDVLMDAFRPFGCISVRFPKAKMNQMGHQPSFCFLDFATHEEAAQCLSDLKGEAAIRNILLTLKWSSSPGGANRQREGGHGGMNPHQQPRFGVPPPPSPKRRNRITEAEAAESTTLFLRLPSTIHSLSYPNELEMMRRLAEKTMENELNGDTPIDSPDRITVAAEPALQVTVRHPNSDMNYGFLEFASHAAALTTLVSLTGQEDGGLVSEGNLATANFSGGTSTTSKNDQAEISNADGDGGGGGAGSEDGNDVPKDLTRLTGVTLYWAKGGQTKAGNGDGGNSSSGKQHGFKFNKRHFPPDSRTDCWFCLASPTCEKHLIVAVHDECYVAMPKGAVNEFHSLIVPVEHGGGGALVNRKLAPEMEIVKSKLRNHARSALQKDLFVFERCIQTKGGYHTHVQCVPVDANSGPAIQSKMLEMAIRSRFELKEITSDLGLNAIEDDWSNGYFYAEIPLPGGGNEFRRFIYRAKNDGSNDGRSRATVPLQFGREVLAEVLGNPDICQWKACVVSQEKEKELTLQFRKSIESLSTK